MTGRDIQAHLTEIYGADISPSLISTVTDSVVDEVAKWQARPLDAVWPTLYLDVIVLKVRPGCGAEQAHLQGVQHQHRTEEGADGRHCQLEPDVGTLV